MEQKHSIIGQESSFIITVMQRARSYLGRKALLSKIHAPVQPKADAGVWVQQCVIRPKSLTHDRLK